MSFDDVLGVTVYKLSRILHTFVKIWTGFSPILFKCGSSVNS